jgi:hypothetical protein
MKVNSSDYDVAYNEATSIYDDVTGKGIAVDDLYTSLMKKERNVLKTIDKLVDVQGNKSRGVMGQTIPELAKNTVNAVMEVIVELGNLAETGVEEGGIVETFTGKKDRLFYIGIATVLVAIAIMLVTMTDK